MTRIVRLRVPDRHAHARQHQRAEILGAARRVLAEMGYDAATLRDIIRRTSLRAATVHELFPDKESILRTLVEDTSRRLRARVRAARDRATSLVQRFLSPPDDDDTDDEDGATATLRAALEAVHAVTRALRAVGLLADQGPLLVPGAPGH